jgi:hypothetical protein
MIAAEAAFVFAIPANTFHWQMEIWKRGGGAWTFDKNGRWGWMWTVKPISDTPSKKRITVPSSQPSVGIERL